MITAGVDLASQPSRTASSEIAWSHGAAEVISLSASGVEDEAILVLLERADKAGLDVPLGWPSTFVAAVTAHHAQRPWSGGSQHELRFRTTDRYVAEETGRWPLSVSSDLIALPAMRAAALMSGVRDGADRSGAGKFVEVYPAAALRRWGFVGHGYKSRAGSENRAALVPAFRARTQAWLHMSDEWWQMCLLSDDAFDAVIAGLVARAQALHRCDAFPESGRALVSREGWIALPFADSLDTLAHE